VQVRRTSQSGLAGVRTAEKTMTAVHKLEQNRQVYSVEGADAVILISPLHSAQLGVTCHMPDPGAPAPLCLPLSRNHQQPALIGHFMANLGRPGSADGRRKGRLSDSPGSLQKLAWIALERPSARLARLPEDSPARLVGTQAQPTPGGIGVQATAQKVTSRRLGEAP
jgi:hypothetical protein